MARFYGEIQGNRGLASRMGARDFWGHLRGWNIGTRVELRPAPGDDEVDLCLISVTGGSQGHSRSLALANVRAGTTDYETGEKEPDYVFTGGLVKEMLDAIIGALEGDADWEDKALEVLDRIGHERMRETVPPRLDL